MAKKATPATPTVDPSTLPRVFVYNGTEIADPAPGTPDKDVQAMLATAMPQLTSATMSALVKDGRRVITFTTAVATKG
jgi:PRTRC genetic system protein C